MKLDMEMIADYPPTYRALVEALVKVNKLVEPKRNRPMVDEFKAIQIIAESALIKAGVLVDETNCSKSNVMIYKNWKIEKTDYDFYEAYSLKNCDEYIKWDKSLDDLKIQIDEHEQ